MSPCTGSDLNSVHIFNPDMYETNLEGLAPNFPLYHAVSANRILWVYAGFW